jgi:hypothetical protein
VRDVADRPARAGVELALRSLPAPALHRTGRSGSVSPLLGYASYRNYHRLHGQLGWQTPAERFEGTPFTDRGFEHVPALAGVADLLSELLATAA